MLKHIQLVRLLDFFYVWMFCLYFCSFEIEYYPKNTALHLLCYNAIVSFSSSILTLMSQQESASLLSKVILLFGSSIFLKKTKNRIWKLVIFRHQRAMVKWRVLHQKYRTSLHVRKNVPAKRYNECSYWRASFQLNFVTTIHDILLHNRFLLLKTVHEREEHRVLAYFACIILWEAFLYYYP